jgi:hypothetical protein
VLNTVLRGFSKPKETTMSNPVITETWILREQGTLDIINTATDDMLFTWPFPRSSITDELRKRGMLAAAAPELARAIVGWLSAASAQDATEAKVKCRAALRKAGIYD